MINSNYPYTKISLQGNITEVTQMTSKNMKQTTQKLNRDEYLILETGEIGEFNHSVSREDSKTQLYRTFRSIRSLVNTNCADPEKLKWVTLTYAQDDGKPMTDAKRLYKDFEKFIKKYRYKWGACEYIAVAEPQGSGAWHMHVLAIYPGKAPYQPNKELAELWGQGFVTVKNVQTVDNIGAYLSAYLGDVEVPAGTPGAIEKELKTGEKKSFIKGGRLKFYPPGMNIYRCSRGIARPIERWVNPEEAKSLLQDSTLTFETDCEWENEKGFKQQIHKEYYNNSRKTKNENI